MPHTLSMIRHPSPDDQQAIDKTLGLDPAVSKSLWDAVDRLVAEIEQHAAWQVEISQGKNRRDQLAYIRKISASLARLETTLQNRDANTDHIIRSQLATTLGELLSHRGFERLIARSPGFEISMHRTRASETHEGPYREFEEDALSRRISLAGETAPKLLLALVSELHRPLLRFLDIERQNRGGAPGKPYRAHVIDALAQIFEKFCGESPTSTPSGKFVMMCEQIFSVIGLDTDGLDKAVPRVLKQHKLR